MIPAVEIQQLTKSFTGQDGSVKALGPVDLVVERGTFVCILGPTGCGKTTLLRLISGLEEPESGSVQVHSHCEGRKALVGYVFQQGALFPWMTVHDNVSFPLRARRMRESEIREPVSRMLEMVGLTDFSDTHPHQLSGGMQQRVALARSLVMEPDVLLLDEPFSSLDTRTSQNLQGKLLDLWHKTGTTVIFVTHNIEEAVFLSSRVCVLAYRPGRIVREEKIDLPLPRDRLSEGFTDYLISLRRTFEELVEEKPLSSAETREQVKSTPQPGFRHPFLPDSCMGPMLPLHQGHPGMRVMRIMSELFRRGRPPR
jgi:ABC-type nitrate/sulfonate/bicarbonate transport system ATPase subunit